MDILRWILKNLKLDDNDEIDLRFGVVTLCIWVAILTFLGAVFYALLHLWELCFLLFALFAGSSGLYLYCRRNVRRAYIITYLFLNVACMLVHYFTTYYLGNCGTVYFMAAALLAPHVHPLLNRRDIFLVDLILVIAINLTYWLSLSNQPLYVCLVRAPFRFIISNLGLITLVFMLYVNISSQDFIKASRQKRIDEASQEVVLDALTGLGNRRMLEQHRTELEQTVSEEFPLCVAIIDIDYFKNINDTYGHLAGDKVLVFIARKMIDSFRKGDLVIRWGGEEFLIFLRRTGVKDAAVLMENFRRSVQGAPVNADGVLIPLHVTIGVKEHRPDTRLDDTIRRSDELMYQGKMRGRNCVVWERK